MNTIAGLCGYIIVIAFAIYTLFCFSAFRGNNKKRSNRVFHSQRVCMFVIHFLCHILIYIIDFDIRIPVLYLVQVIVLFLAIKIYEICYKGLSKLVLNNMIMLLIISFVMLERINIDFAIRQLAIAIVGIVVCLLVPVIIKKFRHFDKLGWQYAFLGIAFLALVFVVGVEKGGARNWINIAGIGFQPSEFVKIIYVFFISALLSKKRSFKYIVVVSAAAAVHVLILVLQKDLGSALIYFITYIIVLYVATKQVGYLVLGMAGGAGASVVAYMLFSHVRTRVFVWRDPFADIDNKGYQIVQSLFAIGMGGWFGLGLGGGRLKVIPVVESDFIFSAICEELGGIFAICLLLVYLSCFIMFINIAIKMKNNFYKLNALGLAVMFIFQIFLAIGGVTKFIPSTGVTLPLISYGGSSILSTILLFSVIQGMYVLNGSEEKSIEEE